MTTTGPRASTVLPLADVVEAHYVLADRAPIFAATIRAHATDLAQTLPDVRAFNDLLHRLVPDRHLGLRGAPGAGADQRPGRPLAGGVRTVQHLEHGACRLDLGPFLDSPTEARPHLEAAARLAAGARVLVLDVRGCHGADPATVALVHGWLLGPEPIVLGRFEHRGRPDVAYLSDPGLEHHFSGEVRVLTSAGTFSGGEDLAYVLQAVGRARVVGERTAGGAHPVEHFPLPGGQVCQMPVARSVIAATGGNWEGVGVLPDVECPADQALAQALADL